MATANQKLYEAALRHQVHLLRFSEGQADRVLKLLTEAEKDLLERIVGAFAAGKNPKRLETVLASVLKRRAQVYKAIGKDLTEQLAGLAGAEAAWETAAIAGSVPIQLNMADVPLETIAAAAGTPINGVPLEGWLDGIGSSEASRLQQAVSMAVIQGQTTDQLAQAIRGTAKGNFEDGILSISRRNAQTLARTAVNHVSNQARETVWDANSDIVRSLRWTSTLDGRTSSVCQARDGHMTPIGKSVLDPGEQPLTPSGARPPAHFNCRSVMVPVLDGVELAGDRPFVADARTREAREADFRADAKKRGVPIQQIRKEWADKNVGRLPAKTTYADWLKGQPKGFQDEILGTARADMFRKGLPLERFVDASGKRLSLEQLRAELAGDALNVIQPAVGMKAKGLMMAGASNDEVLAAIKAEFPDAKTSLSSLATYKTELKKAGLLPEQGGVKTYVGGQGNLAVDYLAGFEENLEPGLKSALKGNWAQVVGSLDGHPGAYAHYKPGVGVVLSGDKFKTLPSLQANQIIAHELGHLLHKEHALGEGEFVALAAFKKAKDMPAELKKLYAYYLSHPDELWAEIVGQALNPGGLTSQGLDAKPFRAFFADEIEKAKGFLSATFPDAPPAFDPGPVIPGAGEMAGKPTSIGAYAKALIKQGMPDEQVLAAVKAEFPDAKTGLNSIKSYKSELKKTQVDAIGKPGPTVHAVPDPEVPPPPPPVPVNWANVPLQKVMEDLVGGKGLAGTGKAYVTGSISASQAIKTVAAVLFKAGLKTDSVWEILTLKFEGTMTGKYIPKKTSLASMKSAFKKDGLLDGPLVPLDKTVTSPSAMNNKGYTPSAPSSYANLPTPKLAGKPLGPFATQAVAKAESVIFQGGGWEDVEGALKLMQFGSGAWDPVGGKDLFDLAWWKVKTGKVSNKPGVAAAVKQSFSFEGAKPLRPATTPREGLPPPPRFSQQDRYGAIRSITMESGMDTTKLATANARQKALGLELLTEEEYSAIRMYTGGHYAKLNRALRSGKFAGDANLQAYVDAALHGLRKMPKHKGYVNRGMSLYGHELDQALAIYKPGAVVEDHSFVSTSTASGFGGNVRLRVLSKTGVDVAPYSRHSSEAEVLFGPGTRFKVTEVTKDGDKVNVTMEEV